MDVSPSSVRVSETKAQTESMMRLVEISAGYWLPRALHVVADLAIADALDQEPRSAADLAKRSEERRVGKECKSGWVPEKYKNNTRDKIAEIENEEMGNAQSELKNR